MVAPNFNWDEFSSPSDSEDQESEIVDNTSPIQESQAQEPEEFQWGDFQSPETYQGKTDPTAEENLFDYSIRNLVSNATRIGEQFLGRHGNVEKIGRDILVNAPETGGVLGWALSQLVGPEKWEQLVRGQKGQERQLFPTSQQFKQVTEGLTGEYTKPKTKNEGKIQEFAEDVGATLSRRSIRNPTARNIGINNILIPAAANVSKEIVKDLGFGDDKANLAKIATWLPLSLAANVNASQFAANLMNMGRNGYGPNVIANVPRYQNQLNGVARNMLQGDPRSALAQQQLAGINNDLANGQTSMRDLMTRYDAINAAKRDRGLFALNPGDRRTAIANINQVRDVVRGEIEHLGQINPQALESWQNGIQAFSTIHRSNAITNWVQSIAQGPHSKLLSGPAAALFGVSSYGGIKNPLIAGTGATALPAMYKTGKTIYRMYQDPNLNNYYWQAISAAQAENVPAFINNYNKLNKGLEKEESNSVNPKSKTKK